MNNYEVLHDGGAPVKMWTRGVPEYCPECGKYWRTSNIYSNTYARVEEYSCENAHRWSRSLRFDGYAADGTRCYTTAPLTKPTLKG